MRHPTIQRRSLGWCRRVGDPPRAILVGPIVLASGSFPHEAGFTNRRSVLQREIDSSSWLDFSVTYSTNLDQCFTRFFPHTSQRCLILSTELGAKSRRKTSKAAIASWIQIRSSLETCPPSDTRARIASSAALTRSKTLLRLISKTAPRYNCHQLFPIISDSSEMPAHAALLFSEVSSSKRAKE